MAKAYSFCRIVDDLADEYTDEILRNQSLLEISNVIKNETENHPIAGPALSLIKKYPEIKIPLLKLVHACLDDRPGIRVSTKEELILYASSVAGTVGLVVYPLLGGRDVRGREYAEALGIAMQFTNIARDVLQDLKDDRVYLPKEWLGNKELSDLLNSGQEEIVVNAVRKILELADTYYEFGLKGLCYLHPDCRKAIEISALCYAEIGQRVIKEKKLPRYRVVVPLQRKISLAVRTYFSKRYQTSKEIVI
jgi:phytoene synthase